MAKAKKSAYETLLEISKGHAVIGSVAELLSWDQETYMPQDGIELRGLQSEALAALLHKEKTSPKFIKALRALINPETKEIVDTNTTKQQQAALREWSRDYLKDSKIPASLVRQFAKTCSKASHVWQEARAHNNFQLFAPHLEKVVSLSRKKADYLGFKEHPYDALLDLYEPDVTTAHLTTLFGRLKLPLIALLRKITAHTPPSTAFLKGTFSKEKQLHFVKQLMPLMGLNPKGTRLDLSAHPFCAPFYPSDIRMTTRIHADDLPSNIFSVLHEGGHALYHQQLPMEHFGSPLCEALSYGIDESQSRWWEVFVGHSLPFWTHFFPLLQQEFPEKLQGVHLNDFYKAINLVKPSLIRVEADEVSYCLHIILRFEIEKALIEGTLKVKDIPDVWRSSMTEYLGVTPQRDDEGCLQDIHWATGGIGYFPSYALGNLYAAQFFASFQKEHPQWKEEIAKGDLLFIGKWLKEKIHRHGREFPPEKLIERVTGEPLSEKAFLSYLEEKYQALFHL